MGPHDDPDQISFDRSLNRIFGLAGCGIVAMIGLAITGVIVAICGVIWLVQTPAVQQLLGY